MGIPDSILLKPGKLTAEETMVMQTHVRIGYNIVCQNASLAPVAEIVLTHALQKVKQLQGLLPICSYCKKIRDDNNYWQQVESYISRHSEAQFSHGICPDCFESIVKPELKESVAKEETR